MAMLPAARAMRIVSPDNVDWAAAIVAAPAI
jgi:hypothetical protein